MKKALITGITGQDGAYLAEFLLVKEMTHHDLEETKKDELLKRSGFKVLSNNE